LPVKIRFMSAFESSFKCNFGLLKNQTNWTKLWSQRAQLQINRQDEVFWTKGSRNSRESL
jgi:hypothetical protein